MHSDLIVRPACDADLAQVAELFGQLGYPNSASDLAQRWSDFTRCDGHCWVAESDGKLLGVITQNYVLPLSTTAEYAVISAFVVDEHVRRSGAGRALMEHAEKAARERGCTHTELSSSMRRPVAHMFYANYGFREVPKRFVFDYKPRAREGNG